MVMINHGSTSTNFWGSFWKYTVVNAAKLSAKRPRPPRDWGLAKSIFQCQWMTILTNCNTCESSIIIIEDMRMWRATWKMSSILSGSGPCSLASQQRSASCAPHSVRSCDSLSSTRDICATVSANSCDSSSADTASSLRMLTPCGHVATLS